VRQSPGDRSNWEDRGQVNVRPEVEQLVAMGKFPHELDATEQQVAEREVLILAIQKPTTDAEAHLLLQILGEDDFWELAWTVVTLIESAPGGPDWAGIRKVDGEWGETLWRRAINAGLEPPT
jgi:hypothetical protein